MTRAIVCGSRDARDWRLVYRGLDCWHITVPLSLLIHGAYRGTDAIADKWAKGMGVKPLPMPADWEALGHKAGPIRNARMLAEGKPDIVLAFPGGPGTADMTRQALKARVPVWRWDGIHWLIVRETSL